MSYPYYGYGHYPYHNHHRRHYGAPYFPQVGYYGSQVSTVYQNMYNAGYQAGVSQTSIINNINRPYAW